MSRCSSFMGKLGAIASVAAVAVSLVGLPGTASATPTFDVFGPLPGTLGSPNEQAAQSLFGQFFDGFLGLSVTARASSPAVSDDGAGTYFAEPGSNNGGQSTTWDFNVYAAGPGNATFADIIFELRYDLDPGRDTPESQLGTVNLNGALGTPGAPAQVIAGFNLLDNVFRIGTVPGIITPPTFRDFDADALGEYSFILAASTPSNNELARVAIDVNVGLPESTTLPEPATLALFGLGLAGLAVAQRRRLR